MKMKGAAALLKGLRSGEVTKLVDQMEDIKGQHDTHTHTPETLVNLEIGFTRNQLEIKKATERRRDRQKALENIRKK